MAILNETRKAVFRSGMGTTNDAMKQTSTPMAMKATSADDGRVRDGRPERADSGTMVDLGFYENR
jgi:hypothetical protein